MKGPASKPPLIGVPVALLVLMALLGHSFSSFASQPNILIMLADDVSANSLGCYGAVNANTSPNIDRLAKQGMLYENMFVSEAICAPARAELYTGLQPVKNGCDRNHGATRKGTLSVVQHLEALGYRVGLAGKRHFKPASVYPFTKVAGFPSDCNRRDAAGEDWSGVRKFMGESAEKPFCLFICSIHAHSPWDSGDTSLWALENLKLPPHFVDTAESRNYFREYLAEVRLFDDQVGKAMQLLDELEIAENTLLIVLDENGAGMPCGKWSSYDWGVRSSCIMRWPGKIESGLRTPAIAQYCDIVPTLIEAAGGSAAEGLDGQSLLSVMKGEKTTHRESAYFIHNHAPVGPSYPIRAVVRGRYKLIWNLNHQGHFASRTINGFDFGYKDKMEDRHVRLMYQSWLEMAKVDKHAEAMVQRFRRRPEFELYDLVDDPWEMKDLSTSPEHKVLVKELHTEILEWMRAQGEVVRPTGRNGSN